MKFPPAGVIKRRFETGSDAVRENWKFFTGANRENGERDKAGTMQLNFNAEAPRNAGKIRISVLASLRV